MSSHTSDSLSRAFLVIIFPAPLAEALDLPTEHWVIHDKASFSRHHPAHIHEASIAPADPCLFISVLIFRFLRLSKVATHP